MHNDTFPSHSNKRRTGTSRVLPPWFSRTPEAGRCASVFEFTLFIEKSVAAVVWKKMKVCACFHQARKLLRELKYQKRCEEAVTTIAAFWHGTQVRYQRARCLLYLLQEKPAPEHLSVSLQTLVFYCSLCSCLKAPQYCKTAVL